MKATVQRWGNSLALRIPQALAAEMGLAEKTAVELVVVEGKLVVAPVGARTQHQRLLEILETAPVDNMGQAWWAEFERDLAESRLSFRAQAEE